MASLSRELVAAAALASALVIVGACGSGKSGNPRGHGGVEADAGILPGTGGTLGVGGTMVIGKGTGGIAAANGGSASGGNGGAPGKGGVLGGTAGRGTGGSVSGGAGGNAFGGTAGGTGGLGGRGSGGAGGVAPLDAGCTGTTCAIDAGTSIDAPPSCSQLLTSTECNLRADCHSVFVDPRNCTCTEVSCCMGFDHCADGGQADCIGPALCNTVPPVCEGQYYAVGIKDGCYEGCVLEHECAVPACPETPPADQTACEPVDHPCFYEDCTNRGRTLATCTGGKWTVQATACGSVTCEGVGVSPLGITCDAGQVCVRTSTSNVVHTVKPSCVANTCGANPITPECIGGLSGTCTVEVSASGGDIYCIMPSPCQGAGGCDYSLR